MAVKRAQKGKRSRTLREADLLAARARDERRVRERAERADRAVKYWPRFVGTPAEEGINEFMRYWTPERVLERWRNEVAALGIDPSKVVQEIEVYNPRFADEKYRFDPWPFRLFVAWWPKDQLQARRTRLQDFVDRLTFEDNRWASGRSLPDGFLDDGPAGSFGPVKGPRYTVEHLVDAKGDPDCNGAVLLCASMFSRAESSRGHYPHDTWPHISIVVTLLDWVRRTQDCRWHDACTDTLPSHDGDRIAITSMDILLQVLALEHAHVLHSTVPVVVRFMASPAPTRLRQVK